MGECVFCAIIDGSIPTDKIVETDNLIVIKDISPKASTHYLIIPKKHIPDMKSLKTDDLQLAGDMMLMATALSQDLPEPGAFRIIINNGAGAGQCVFHLHMHFLAGKKMPEF
jgi:histidine triad (HIT) family protein